MKVNYSVVDAGNMQKIKAGYYVLDEAHNDIYIIVEKDYDGDVLYNMYELSSGSYWHEYMPLESLERDIKHSKMKVFRSGDMHITLKDRVI